ncbi:unnamed protein product [Scytosiphon promiscuus]
MTAFSSLPSRSADSGKLAPLDVGQRSPRSNAAPRPSLASSPREHRDYSAEGMSFSLPQSGSSSPRSMSPRLPPMKSAPSPAMDDSSLPGLGQGLSPRKGAQSARRVRSLSPNIQRASVTDRASSGSLRPQSRGGTSGSGGGSNSNNRISPLLEAKERECRRGDKDPMVKSSAISSTGNGSRRREGGGNGELAGGRGGGVDERLRISGDAAEAKHDATGERPTCTRLPGTTSTLQSRERESSNCSSSGGLLGTTFSLTSTSTNERFERRDRPSREELASTTRGDVFPDEDNHARGNRQQHRKEETKDCGSTPSIPSIGRGEDSSRSPRTRRMRPQVDSTA